MVYVLGHCMLQGNKIHETLKSRGSLNNINLTVPEAIKYAGNNVAGLTEWVGNFFNCNRYSTKLLLFFLH